MMETVFMIIGYILWRQGFLYTNLELVLLTFGGLGWTTKKIRDVSKK